MIISRTINEKLRYHVSVWIAVRVTQGRVMLVAGIIAGMLVGMICYLPFDFATKKVRKTNPTHSAGMAGWFFFAISISFLILFASIVLCKFLLPAVLIAYAIAAVVAFIVTVIVLSLLRLKTKK